MSQRGRVLSLILAIGAAFVSEAQEYRQRAFWGNETLWGYWEFDKDYLPKHSWKISGAPQEGLANLIDDNVQSYYGPRGQDSYEVTIDLGKSFDLGAFTILTLNPVDPKLDSNPARFEFHVHDGKDPGKPVASGPIETAAGKETVVAFPAAKGRFVTFKAWPAPNAQKLLTIREFSLVEATVVAQRQARPDNTAAEKQKRWNDRRTSAAIDALGAEFLDLLFCTREEINRSNLQGRKKLEEVGKLKAAGKYAEGLKAFRDYYFDKLRRPQAFGLHANDVSPWGKGFAGMGEFPQAPLPKELESEDFRSKQIAMADDLLKGVLTLGKGTKLEIGEPGSVDWMAPGAPYGHSTAAKVSEPYRELWQGTGIQPLFIAFMVTRKEDYLKRWLAYMDDWSLHSTFLGDLHPVISNDNCLYPLVPTLRMFGGIAAALPIDSDLVPPDVFARIMKKLVLESPLNSIVYFRSNPNAWTPGAGMMLFTMLIDEFKAAPVYFRETRRRNIEDINAIQLLRDGTDPHQWPGYNPLVLINTSVLRLMSQRESMPTWMQPKWERDLHTPEWQGELLELLGKRASYVLHWATPNGEYPLVSHFEPPSQRQKLREVFDRLPSVVNDPTNAALYSTLYGSGAGPLPAYTADWFPYGGWNIARTGWGDGEGYGAMFCSPGAGSGGTGSGCKNNAFGLAAYGMDLLADDLAHFYVRRTSPISVDKRPQNMEFSMPRAGWPTGHRGELMSTWTDPAPWRWHASDDFNLMEGVYSGVYSHSSKDRTDYIDDVSHQRVALFARRAGLWILTDRLRTSKKHDYEQLWWFPLRQAKRQTGGFAPEEIVIDPAAKSIQTRRTRSDKAAGNVNLSMVQVTDAPLKYESKTMPSKEEMYDWQRVGATWTGEGDQQIVTLLFPRKPTPEKATPDGTENDLKSINPVPGGFDAVTPDATQVGFRASKKSEPLQVGPVSIQGEALLVVRLGPSRQFTGVALGCTEMTIQGVKVAVPGPDVEFSHPANGRTQFLPIYRPISPVRILPEAEAFAGELDVTLRCDTPGVRMTYTLDGTEPTPRSTSYAGPFKIARSMSVKARAYRAGVEQNPPHTSGTLSTPTTHAVYTQQLASPPEKAVPKAAGLNYEYYEGDWKQLWLAMDKVAPLKKGSVASLFDMTAIPEDNRLLGAKPGPRAKTYAFKYSGYLQVPEDGVYTIHAPHEFVHPDTIAGYELQVSLGHALTPDAAGAKREESLSFWYPSTRLQGFGSWSVPLQKGVHEFKVVYIDFRTDGPRSLNVVANVRDCVWSGEQPDLRISGPGIDKQAIPPGWLGH
jgi:hypothetical protein